MSSRAQRDTPLELVMSLSFTHLGTGSRGNATLVESGDAKVLIDQGFSGKQLEIRLARMDIKPQEGHLLHKEDGTFLFFAMIGLQLHSIWI